MTKKEPAREFWINEHVVLVDDEDYPYLSRFTWSVKADKNTFYAITNVKIGAKNHSISMHRMVTGFVASDIDHINRNGLDNRKENLRHATKQQNSFNRKRKNSIGYRGVFKPRKSPNYSYQIQCSGKRYSKNGFKTAEDAARAYDLVCLKLHGEFGILNFPKEKSSE